MPRSRKPPRTTILLVRHGRTPTTGTVLPGRAKGLHLSEEGRAQADAAAERISAGPALAAVYSSPLERCRETAAPTAKATGNRVRAHRGLLECDFGDWTGQRIADLARTAEWSVVQGAPSQFRFPGGESFLEMQARIVDTLATLAREHPGEQIAVFSHADPIKAAVAAALGMPLDTFQRLTVSPCSVSAITYGGPAPLVLTVNSTDEIGALQPS